MLPMRTRAWILAIGFMVVPLSTSAVAAPVLAPGSTVEGRTLGEWSAAYWQWIFSFTDRLVLDTTGDPVYFLGASPGTPVAYDVRIPEGRYLFFPALTTADSVGPDETADDVRQRIANIRPLITELHATLNGVPIPNLFDHWEESPVFSATIPPDGFFSPPGTFDALAGGYWLMLEPLPRGRHVLNFGGAVPAVGFAADATATITVVPEPGSVGLMLTGLALVAWRATRRKNHRH
jgi:hypothetical protein